MLLLLPWATGLLFWALVQQGHGERKLALDGPPSCAPQPSCDLCIQTQPACSWCKQRNFTQVGEPDSTRCDSEGNLLRRGCRREELVNPSSSHQILQSRGLGQAVEGGGRVQIAPQKISLSLRPGLEEIFQVKFRRAQGYPVDLYYLMDLSYSMKDDLENIQQLGNNLLVTLRNITKSVKIGFGSFVDKTVLPFVSLLPQKQRNPCPDRSERCQPPFSYRNVLPLTDDAGEFEREVGQQGISGNLDPPEGGLDAMMQAAVCEDQVGWRNVTRLLVYTSDAGFHTAGDGHLGGIFLPNDARCHLDRHGLYAESNRYDYPSVGQVAQTLSRLNIQPIFAVTQNVLPVYQELSKLIPKSVVGELRADSSNVLQLISEAYNNLSSTVSLVHSSLPHGVSVQVESQCRLKSSGWSDHGECTDVHINEEIGFSVRVRADRCLDPGLGFELRVLGFSELLEVRVQAVCSCDCGDGGTESADRHCSHGNGTLNCGQCSCHPRRLGKFCECSRDDVQSEDVLQPCRRVNTTELCSGRGRCLCGKCDCDRNLRGQFCECDDSSCVRQKSKLCAGNGRCLCGRCICNAQYTGEACDCRQGIKNCLHTDGSICAGHGVCRCGACECERGFSGPTCSECLHCPTDCQLLTDCAECLAFKTGPLMENCEESCHNMTVVVAKKLPESDSLCMERLSDGELIEFVVEEMDTGKTLLVEERELPTDNRLVVACSVMVGIVLVGLLVLVSCRSAVEIRDRREYQQFIKEQERSRWDSQRNPLYQEATTTTVNPQFLPD